MILLIVLVHFIASYDLTCFSYRRLFNVSNTDEISYSDVDISLEVSTKEFVESSKMSNCSNLRFELDGSLLNYYIENDCKTSNRTRIWLTLPSLPVNGKVVTMYFGCSDVSKLPVDGYRIPWNGRFFSLTNSTSCEFSWSSVDLLAKDRFLKFSNSFGGNIDATFTTHTHKASGFLEPSLDGNQSALLGCEIAVGGHAEDTHFHNFTDVISSTPYPTQLPPYYTLRICESEYLELFKGSILPYNSTTISTTDYARFEELEGRFILLSDTPSQIGGSEFHNHTFEEYFVNSSVTDVVTTYENTGSVEEELASSNHTHDIFFTSDPKSNLPTASTLPFIILLDNFTLDVMNHYTELNQDTKFFFLADSIPPKGFILESETGTLLEGKYVQGGTNVNFTSTTADLSPETISSSSFTHSLSVDYENYICDNHTMEPEIVYNDHTHPSLTLTDLQVNSGGFDPNDLDRFQVLALSRKYNPAFQIYEDEVEEALVWCFGIESRDGRVCSDGRGDCMMTDLCSCHTGFFGDLCNVTVCDGVFSNDTVCSGHGSCVSPEVCVCENETLWFGEYCDVTTCNGVFSNISSSIICSGRGVCDSYDFCNCTDPGYGGSLCENIMCHGVENTSLSVCNSPYGVCEGIDECVCDRGGGYTGLGCDERILGYPTHSYRFIGRSTLQIFYFSPETESIYHDASCDVDVMIRNKDDVFGEDAGSITCLWKFEPDIDIFRRRSFGDSNNVTCFEISLEDEFPVLSVESNHSIEIFSPSNPIESSLLTIFVIGLGPSDENEEEEDDDDDSDDDESNELLTIIGVVALGVVAVVGVMLLICAFCMVALCIFIVFVFALFADVIISFLAAAVGGGTAMASEASKEDAKDMGLLVDNIREQEERKKKMRTYMMKYKEKRVERGEGEVELPPLKSEIVKNKKMRTIAARNKKMRTIAAAKKRRKERMRKKIEEEEEESSSDDSSSDEIAVSVEYDDDDEEEEEEKVVEKKKKKKKKKKVKNDVEMEEMASPPPPPPPPIDGNFRLSTDMDKEEEEEEEEEDDSDEVSSDDESSEDDTVMVRKETESESDSSDGFPDDSSSGEDIDF